MSFYVTMSVKDRLLTIKGMHPNWALNALSMKKTISTVFTIEMSFRG